MNAIIQTTATVPASVDQQRRVAAAVAALASNTRRAYGSAWSGWERWAADRGRQVLPATAADVADYLETRHAAGASPATVRTARAAGAKVHQVSGLADPTADGLCRDVLRKSVGRRGLFLPPRPPRFSLASLRSAPVRSASFRSTARILASRKSASRSTAPQRVAPYRSAPTRRAPVRSELLRSAPYSRAPLRSAPTSLALRQSTSQIFAAQHPATQVGTAPRLILHRETGSRSAAPLMARQALLSSVRGRTDFHSPGTPGHGARSRTHPTVQRQAGSPDNSAWRRRARSAGTHRLCGLQAPSRRALAMSTNRPAPDAAGGAAGGCAVRYRCFVPL